MENKSILDQIIQNQKAEEVSRLDAVEIINNLFSELSERERDVLIRRFGLHGNEKETLENIGSAHKLTRERIRQIETSSVRKLRQLQNLDKYIETLKHVIVELLEEHGGIMEKDYLLQVLVKYSTNTNRRDNNEEVHKSYLNFLITKLLHNEFEETKNSKYFKPSYKLKYQAMDHLEELLVELLDRIESSQEIRLTHDLIELIKELETYKKHQEKLEIANNLDISSALYSELFSEDTNLINEHKSLYSLLVAAKNIEQNKFGYWGVATLREIKPKTINDKIYLVLKHSGKPMHFVEISDNINNIGFDGKKANPATVHNELILDTKYVLVGRGLYGLKEWGFEKGTVADVIAEILEQVGKPLTRDEILQKVLEKRVVKKTTVILALMNKDRFEKINGKYQLKK